MSRKSRREGRMKKGEMSNQQEGEGKTKNQGSQQNKKRSIGRTKNGQKAHIM